MEGYLYSSGLARPRHIQAALMGLSGSGEHKLGRYGNTGEKLQWEGWVDMITLHYICV